MNGMPITREADDVWAEILDKAQDRRVSGEPVYTLVDKVPNRIIKVEKDKILRQSDKAYSAEKGPSEVSRKDVEKIWNALRERGQAVEGEDVKVLRFAWALIAEFIGGIEFRSDPFRLVVTDDALANQNYRHNDTEDEDTVKNRFVALLRERTGLEFTPSAAHSGQVLESASCLVRLQYSRAHPVGSNPSYFFGIPQAIFRELNASGKLFVVFLCASHEKAVIVPGPVLSDLLEKVPSARDGSWKMRLYERQGAYSLNLAGQPECEMTKYLNRFDFIKAADLSQYSGRGTPTLEDNYFILQLGSPEWDDKPQTEYHFKEGIPGYVQLRDAAHHAQFVYYKDGRFFAKGRIGEVRNEVKDQVAQFYANINEYQEFGPVAFDAVKAALGFDAIGRAGIRKITRQQFDTLTGTTKGTGSADKFLQPILTYNQLENLKRAYLEFSKRTVTTEEIDWSNRIQNAQKEYAEIISSSNFSVTKLMSLDQAKRIGQVILQQFSHNDGLSVYVSTRLKTEDELMTFCERLHSLLYGSDELLPQRIQSFDALPGIGQQTTTQFLAFHYPDRFPMISKQEISVIRPEISDSQVAHAYQTFAYPPETNEQTDQETKDTLGLITIFQEIKQALGIQDYIELNKFLIFLYYRPEAPPSAPNEKELLAHIIGYIQASGYTFADELIKNYWVCIKTKPFILLTGIAGIGKTALTKLFAKAIGGGENYRRIAVKADWRDDTDLLGYVNPLKNPPEYAKTEFLELLLEAAQHRDALFFVCLDEMNLARVEYYFAKFLSGLETEDRTIVLHSSKEIVDVPQKLVIPDHVMFVGTVNMDETTFAFSPKVLDRANTIEISNPKLDEVHGKGAEVNPIPISAPQFDSYCKRDVLANEPAALADTLVELTKINELIKVKNQKFGFRVRNEIVAYIANSDGIFSEDHEENRRTAFDIQLKQKILPKLSGSGKDLKDTLAGLQQYLQENAYGRSLAKVNDMITRLDRDGFTSFYD